MRPQVERTDVRRLASLIIYDILEEGYEAPGRFVKRVDVDDDVHECLRRLAAEQKQLTGYGKVSVNLVLRALLRANGLMP